MLAQSEIDALLSGTIDMDQQNGGDRVNLANMINQPGDAPKAEGEEKRASKPTTSGHLPDFPRNRCAPSNLCMKIFVNA